MTPGPSLDDWPLLDCPLFVLRKIGIFMPSKQRQHCTLHIQEDVLPYALCY